MQVQIKCNDCPDIHWLNSYYIFEPKIGPLREGHCYRGTNSVLVENIAELTRVAVETQLKALAPVLDVEYGFCSECGRDREHITSHSEFADFGILNFYENPASFDSPDFNFLDSTRQRVSTNQTASETQVSNQSEIFRDSTLESVAGYLGSITIEAEIVPLETIPEVYELTQ